MLQKIVNNLEGIGLVIAFLYALIYWFKHKKKQKKHPSFKVLFEKFSIVYLIYAGVISSLLALYLIIFPIIGISLVEISSNEIKYPLIIGGLALLYLGVTKFKDEEL